LEIGGKEKLYGDQPDDPHLKVWNRGQRKRAKNEMPKRLTCRIEIAKQMRKILQNPQALQKKFS